jgi:hypothetical protein
MTILGYYAKPIQKGNTSEPALYPYEWNDKNELFIFIEGVRTKVNENDYEILEIAYLTDED